MTHTQFAEAEKYMLGCMQQSVHDPAHVYRVLYAALRIAATEPKANTDVVILAALLHDVGRDEAENKPKLHHAELGATMVYAYLIKKDWPEATAAHVRDCIFTHSYSAGRTPATLEAQILYDADKLDLTGALGVARATLFGAQINEPFYLVDSDGQPTAGKKGEGPSLFREYNRKLKKLHERFYTKEGKRLAQRRQRTMDAYFEGLGREVRGLYGRGVPALQNLLQNDNPKPDTSK